jgi:hypothetical protein
MKQYLIISKDCSGRIYSYREDEQHHLVTEEQRISDGQTRLPNYKLDEECYLGQYPRNIYFVFEV